MANGKTRKKASDGNFYHGEMVLIALFLFLIFVPFRVFAATTIGNNISTTGTLAVSGTLTFGAITGTALQLTSGAASGLVLRSDASGNGAWTAVGTILGGGFFSDLSDVEIASAVVGDLLYYNGTNWVNLADGAAGQALTSDGAGGLSWMTISVVLGANTAGDYVAGLTAGSGIAVSGSVGEGWSPTVGVDAITTGTTALTSLNSGIEATASGIRLLGGCANGQILKWVSATSSWDCAADATLGGGEVDTALSNLASVAINESLLPGTTNSIDLGSDSFHWNDIFLGAGNIIAEGSTDNEFETFLAFSNPTADNTITFPNTSGIVAVLASAPLSLSAGGDISCSTCLTPSLADNVADALDIQEGARNYININTTDSSENVALGNTTTNPTFSFLGNGLATFGGGVSVSGTLTVSTLSTTSGNITLQPAGAGVTANVQIGAGSGSTTPDLLVLDLKSSSGDPTGTDGAVYYNSNTSKFRCYQGGAWTDCIGSGSSLSASVKYKSADESVTSSTTLQDDDALTFSIDAGETWVGTIVMQALTASGTPDIKLAVTAPSGAVCDVNYAIMNGTANTKADLGCGVSSGNIPLVANVNAYIIINLSVQNGSTAGAVTLQWAQNASNVNAVTVKQGSHLQVFKTN